MRAWRKALRFDSGAGRFWNKDANLFVQDDIHLTPQLTVNVGLRWEYRGPWYERSGGGKTFDYSYPGGRALYRGQELRGSGEQSDLRQLLFLRLGLQPGLQGISLPASGLPGVLCPAPTALSCAPATEFTTTCWTVITTCCPIRSTSLTFCRRCRP